MSGLCDCRGMQTDFISPEVIARAKGLYIKVREIAGLFYTGIQRSKVKGRGTDFFEYRLYSKGDDIKDIDWKVLGKLDKLYVKKREDPSRVDIITLLDDSLSMDYGKGMENKFEFARVLTATISYISGEQGDRIGLFTFSKSASIPPSSTNNSFYEILKVLSEISPSSKLFLLDGIKNIIPLLKKNSKIIIISDLLGSDTGIFEMLKVLKGLKCEVDVIRILTDKELSFNFFEDTIFIDPETGEKLAVSPQLVRNAFIEHLKEWDELMKDYFYRVRGKYITVNTSNRVEEVLFSLVD